MIFPRLAARQAIRTALPLRLRSEDSKALRYLLVARPVGEILGLVTRQLSGHHIRVQRLLGGSRKIPFRILFPGGKSVVRHDGRAYPGTTYPVTAYPVPTLEGEWCFTPWMPQHPTEIPTAAFSERRGVECRTPDPRGTTVAGENCPGWAGSRDTPKDDHPKPAVGKVGRHYPKRGLRGRTIYQSNRYFALFPTALAM